MKRTVGGIGQVDVRLLWELDHKRCHICKNPLKLNEAVLDHVIPRTAAGRYDVPVKQIDQLRNLRVAHARCNVQKNARPLGQPRLFVCLSQDAEKKVVNG